MEILEKAGINTHFIKTLSEREQLVKKLKLYTGGKNIVPGG